ncbi:MAG TPA: hypothetical protein VLK84_12285 [Longimicrobium sp.]|nr:hypothetical protein [Longimicrobium sp.]
MIPPSLLSVVVSAGTWIAVLALTDVDGASPAALAGSTADGVVQAPVSNSMGMMNFKRRMGPPGRGRLARADDDPKMNPARVHLQHIGSTK